jgi:hypothetical protein
MRLRAAAVAALADLNEPSDRDCVVFARLVLRRAYGAEVVDAVPLWRWHLIRESGAGPWEPASAAEAAGITEDMWIAVGAQAMDYTAALVAHGRAHLVQGWRGEPFAPGVTGHSFIWLTTPGTDGYGEVLDSTRDRGPRLTGLLRWADYVGQFRAGGCAVAALRRPP